MLMNCEKFREHLDAYTDGELTADERREMEGHAKACAACGKLMQEAETLAELCAEMNRGLTVPLSAQAAWRRAVRADAGPVRRRSGGWMKGMAAAAAALVVLVTGTYGMRMSGQIQPVSEPAAIGMQESVPAAGGYSMYYDTDAGSMSRMSSKATTGLSLQSDGETGTKRSADLTAAASEDMLLMRSAELTMQTENYDSDYMWLQDLVSEYGAYFEERTETAASSADMTGRAVIATIRVPGDRLNDFLMELDQLGETLRRSERAEDVTVRQADAQAQLDALRAQKNKLDELLTSAESVDELIAVDDRLTGVIASMEMLEDEIRRWESAQSYSSVNLTLTEKTAAARTQTDAPLSERMKQGFGESVEWLGEFCRDAMVTLASALPRLVVWIPAAALVIIGISAAFRRRNRR